MSTTTTYLSLTKPDLVDLAAIGVINANMDTIDGWFASQAAGTVSFGASASAGSSSRIARADHVHDTTGLGYGTPVAVGASNSSGVATTVARSDHVHQAPVVYLNHGPETFDINSGITEDIRVYTPANLTSATLILRGRRLVAGLVGAHTHVASTVLTLVATATSNGGESTNTGSGSSHNHGGGNTGAGSSHNHGLTGMSASGGHEHQLLVDTSGAGTIVLSAAANGLRSGFTDNPGNHTHSGPTDGEASHTHSITHEASHTHPFSTSNHTHSVSFGTATATTTNALEGSGGFTATSRPAGVTVTIDGVDRTSALGGSFGSSGADWDQQALDILSYVNSVGWHTIEFGCTTGGRLKAQVLMQV